MVERHENLMNEGRRKWALDWLVTADRTSSTNNVRFTIGDLLSQADQIVDFLQTENRREDEPST